jgi:hypothetical protein
MVIAFLIFVVGAAAAIWIVYQRPRPESSKPG